MSFADHFSTIAKQYARYRPRYPDALVDVLAGHCAEHRLAWDAGCGNGQLTVMLARRFDKVVGTEPSQAQVDNADHDPRVEYLVAKAEASVLAPGSVDLAVAAQAAHWFDWPRYVAEVARVTKPGSAVALVSYGITDADGEVGELLARYRDAVEPYWPPERVHVDNGYRDLAWPWPAIPVAPIDMTAQWTREQTLGYVATWSATVKMSDAIGPGAYETLERALARIWPDGEARTIRWPLTVRLARR